MIAYPETRGTLVDMPIDFLTFNDDDINSTYQTNFMGHGETLVTFLNH